MSKCLNQTVQVFRIDTEEEVQAFIEELKASAVEGGYILKSCAYTLKEKKLKSLMIQFIKNKQCFGFQYAKLVFLFKYQQKIVSLRGLSVHFL